MYNFLLQPMDRGDPIQGAASGHVFVASVPASRPETDFTPRISAYHGEAYIPMESALIAWRR
jgi:glycogen phosphorylase